MRYSAFLTGEDSFISEKYSREFRIYKNNVTDKYFTCHQRIHKKKRTSKKSEIDELYFNAKKNCGKMYGDLIDERMDSIKSILLSNLEELRSDTNKDSEIYDNMIAGLDSYISKRKDIESFNIQQRQKRFYRKFAFNRAEFNYAFTVTWSSELYETSEEWLESLLRYFGNICFRKGVRIMGAFEFGDENGRIHFHGVGYFPEDFFGDGLHYVKRYSTKRHCWEQSLEYEHIAKRFGINEFDSLKTKSKAELSRVLGYISKYVIKNNGRTYYSRGLEDGVDQFIDPKYCFYEFESKGMIKYKLAESFSFDKERFFRKLKELKGGKLPFDTSE